jgi:hypothetical protein
MINIFFRDCIPADYESYNKEMTNIARANNAFLSQNNLWVGELSVAARRYMLRNYNSIFDIMIPAVLRCCDIPIRWMNFNDDLPDPLQIVFDESTGLRAYLDAVNWRIVVTRNG